MRLGDDEFVDIEVMIVLGIGDRRLQTFADIPGDALARELEVGERTCDLLAADQAGNQVELLRTDPEHPGDRLGLVIGEAAFARLLAHRSRLMPSGSEPGPRPGPVKRRGPVWLCGRPNGRRRCASARTRRTCDRPSPRSPSPGYVSGRCRRRMSPRRIAAEWSNAATRS